MTHLKCSLILALIAGICSGCGAKDQTLASQQTAPEAVSPSPTGRIFNWHFVGGHTVGADARAASLKALLALPESLALKEDVLAKLSRLPIKLIQRHGRQITNDCAALIRPLLDDLAGTESLVEMRGETNQTPEMVLAVRLDEARARFWQTNLATILTTWTGIQVTDIPSGWELKKHHAPDLIRFVRAGDWVILGAGQGKISLADEWVAAIKADGRPCPVAKDHWLTVECDWDRLSKHIPIPDAVGLPHISRWQITLNGREDNNLGTRIVMGRDEAFDWKPEPWRIPTNTIRDPLISLTAAQGVGKWLSLHAGLMPFKLDPMPNQIYTWALAGVQFQTYAAMATANATNALEQLGPQVLSLNPQISARGLGQIDWRPDHTGLNWGGVPFFLVPFMEAVREPGGDFLFAGVFPNSPRRAVFPPGLLAQIVGRTNLLYYDWEITSERLPGLRYLTQLALLLTNHEQVDAESPAGKWINNVHPKLGAAVTEVTLSKPNEITLLRKSPIGLTSLELLVLGNWVQSQDFPLDALVRPVKQTKVPPGRRLAAPPMVP